jgi:hypothetical protein
VLEEEQARTRKGQFKAYTDLKCQVSRNAAKERANPQWVANV